MTFTKKWRFGNLNIRKDGSYMADLNPKSYFIGMIFRYSGVLWSLRLRTELKIQKLKLADPIVAPTCQKLIDFDEIWYSGVFGVADYESELNIKKLIMVDPIWLTKLSLEIFWFDELLSRKRFIKYYKILLYIYFLRNIYKVFFFRILSLLENHFI